MKFQKGLLGDLTEEEKAAARLAAKTALPAPQAPPRPQVVENDRLFETHQRTTRSWQQYVKLLGIVSVLVVIGGGVIFYMTLPSVGDKVRAPAGMEDAVRAHFLDKEKRPANDIGFYYCGGSYWARVEVEKRPDIKTDPVYQIGTYAARVTGSQEQGWSITAAPITSREADVPCS